MKVLFVCSGNACRSPAAEAFLKKFNSAIDVDSAGSHAYYKIIAITSDYLKKHNADRYLKRVPQDLSSKQLNEYDLIVAMEPNHRDQILAKCPECADKIIVWSIKDPYNLPIESVERIFDQIRHKTKDLAESL